jgi:iron complex outermembrane receptor protein
MHHPGKICSLMVLFLPWIIFMAICTVPAQAEEESGESEEISEEEVIDLGTILVEDESIEGDEVIDRPTSFVSVIDPSELLDQSLTLPEALQGLPGISIRSFGGLGQLSSISIRSPGSENVLVLLDGVPLNPAGGPVDLSDIPLSALEKIEVIRGGQGAYSGAGAVGGVIRLTSIENSEEEIQSLRLSCGSFSTIQTAYSFTSANDTFTLDLTGSRDDFPFLNNNGTEFNTLDDFPDTRINNEYSAISLSFGHEWDLDDFRSFRITGELYNAEKGIPGIITFLSRETSQDDTRYFIHALYSDENYQQGELNLSLGWLRQDRNFNDPLGESTGVPHEVNRKHSRWDFQSGWTGPGISDRDIASFGFSLAIEEMSGISDGDISRDTVSLWVHDEYYHESNSVFTGGVRMDSLDGDMNFSPAIGGKIPLGENTFLQGNFGMDFRPPSFEELYRNEGFVTGNPDLVPERVLHFDAGIVYQEEKIRIEAVYFNQQTKNLIDYLLISGFRFKPFNLGRVRSSGFEFSTDFFISSNLRFSGNYTRTVAIDISGNPTSQSHLIVGQPVSEAYAELRWSDNGWELFGNWQRSGSTPVTVSGSGFIPVNEISGAGIGKIFGDDSSLVFEIKNLFDEDLSDVRGFPLPGRSYFLTYRTEW